MLGEELEQRVKPQHGVDSEFNMASLRSPFVLFALLISFSGTGGEPLRRCIELVSVGLGTGYKVN